MIFKKRISRSGRKRRTVTIEKKIRLIRDVIGRRAIRSKEESRIVNKRREHEKRRPDTIL